MHTMPVLGSNIRKIKTLYSDLILKCGNHCQSQVLYVIVLSLYDVTGSSARSSTIQGPGVFFCSGTMPHAFCYWSFNASSSIEPVVID